MHLQLNDAKTMPGPINSFPALASFSAPICLSIIIILIPSQAGPRTIHFAQSRNGNVWSRTVFFYGLE